PRTKGSIPALQYQITLGASADRPIRQRGCIFVEEVLVLAGECQSGFRAYGIPRDNRCWLRFGWGRIVQHVRLKAQHYQRYAWAVEHQRGIHRVGVPRESKLHDGLGKATKRESLRVQHNVADIWLRGSVGLEPCNYVVEVLTCYVRSIVEPVIRRLICSHRFSLSRLSAAVARFS